LGTLHNKNSNKLEYSQTKHKSHHLSTPPNAYQQRTTNPNTSPPKRLGRVRNLYNKNIYLTTQTHHTRCNIIPKNKENKPHFTITHTHTTKTIRFTHLNKTNKKHKTSAQVYNQTPKTPPKYIHTQGKHTSTHKNKQNKHLKNTLINNIPYKTQRCKKQIYTNKNTPKTIQLKIVTNTRNHNGPRPTGLGHRIHKNIPPHVNNIDKHSSTIRKIGQKIK
jgi:hypothetical protein